ncbi:MAG: DUF1731 domain-containing protein [Anaerolineales bacterium]|nr:DUF1731 domain-containing protein [Anaerolineales bacterium]
MSVLIVEGRFAQSKRLTQSGYQFQYAAAGDAVSDLFKLK